MNGSWVDPDFKPHPVLPDPIHKARVLKMQSIAGPDVIDQIGKTVHDAAMKGADANPALVRDGPIKNYPMFTYPKTQTPDPAATEAQANGAALPEDNAPAIVEDKKAVAAAKVLRATEATEERAAEKLKESKEPKIEGIEANRVAATKKMETDAKKGKELPPVVAEPAAAEPSLAQKK